MGVACHGLGVALQDIGLRCRLGNGVDIVFACEVHHPAADGVDGVDAVDAVLRSDLQEIAVGQRHGGADEDVAGIHHGAILRHGAGCEGDARSGRLHLAPVGQLHQAAFACGAAQHHGGGSIIDTLRAVPVLPVEVAGFGSQRNLHRGARRHCHPRTGAAAGVAFAALGDVFAVEGRAGDGPAWFAFNDEDIG